MTTPPSRRATDTYARLQALEAQVEATQRQVQQMQADARAAAESAKETHDMVRQIADALLKPQPGHTHNLLDRVAAVTIKVERGEWSMRALLGLVAAAISVMALLTGWMKWHS
jgi:anti-sigma28 factor (negative regulator of flagellin synthesis)